MNAPPTGLSTALRLRQPAANCSDWTGCAEDTGFGCGQDVRAVGEKAGVPLALKSRAGSTLCQEPTSSR